MKGMSSEIAELLFAAKDACRQHIMADERRYAMSRLGAAVAVVEIRWRSEKVQHFLKIVDGLYALRAVAPLDYSTEGEITELQDDLWRTMTQDEHAEVEIGIEAIKERWDERSE